MADDSTNQSLWEKLENLPGYQQAALGSVFIPIAAVLYSCLALVFPAMFYPLPFLGVPLAMFGLGFAISSIVGGTRPRMSGIVVLGLVGFVLNGLAGLWIFEFFASIFALASGC